MRIASLIALALAAAPAGADTGCAADAMLVFDGSASMSEIGFDVQDATRITEARAAVAEVMPRVERFRRIGLLTYGPGGADGCSGISLRFGPQDRAGARVIAELDALRPGGLTPLAVAVEQAAEALEYRARPAVIVLVTDGNETCGGTPCATSRRMTDQAADLIVHVIGFRASGDFFAWNNPEQTFGEDTVAKCFADRTGGTFATAETVDELVEALNRTLGCPVIGALSTKPMRRPG
jgi:Ca-activated chloride channel family protein